MLSCYHSHTKTIWRSNDFAIHSPVFTKNIKPMFATKILCEELHLTLLRMNEWIISRYNDKNLWENASRHNVSGNHILETQNVCKQVRRSSNIEGASLNHPLEWERFLRTGMLPVAGGRCLKLGSRDEHHFSPALKKISLERKLLYHVLSVDEEEIDQQISFVEETLKWSVKTS